MSDQLPDDAVAAGVAAEAKFFDDDEDIMWPSDQMPEQLVRRILEAAAPAIADRAAAAERERWLAILTEHFLYRVECDPVRKLDNPICGCCRVFLGWHPSVGEAITAWIRHVADLLDGGTDGQ